MKTAAFLSRLALICNLLFVLCLVIQRTHDFIGSQPVNMIIIILGWFPVAPLLNTTTCLVYLWRSLAHKPMGVRPWLVMTNCVFMAIQLFVYFILVS